MREDPRRDVDAIAACLDAEYGIEVDSVTFLPIGYDLDAAVYQVASGDGSSYFLKIKNGPPNEAGLLVPSAIADLGIEEVIAPLRTRSSALWCALDGDSVVLYPFVDGKDAGVAGLTDEQWRIFGSTLRSIHDSRLADRFRGRLSVETFALPSAAVVRRLLAAIDGRRFESLAAARFADFWRDRAEQIRAMLARAEALGERLRDRSFELVLCHADIHAANILVGNDCRIHLIDWDGPLIAPRERDLLFVIGSQIARTVEPREEALFFEGYGSVRVDPVVLTYYRYERVIEDIGEIGKSIFLDPRIREQTRAADAALVMRFFEPGGAIERAETVTCHASAVQFV